jgi:hypothetical protein
LIGRVLLTRCRSTVAKTPDGVTGRCAEGGVARTPDGGTETGAAGGAATTPEGGAEEGPCATRLGLIVCPTAIIVAANRPKPNATQDTPVFIALLSVDTNVRFSSIPTKSRRKSPGSATANGPGRLASSRPPEPGAREHSIKFVINAKNRQCRSRFRANNAFPKRRRRCFDSFARCVGAVPGFRR